MGGFNFIFCAAENFIKTVGFDFIVSNANDFIKNSESSTLSTKNIKTSFLYPTDTSNAESLCFQGLIVIRYYLALRGAENGVTVMVTPFFCVQG